MPLVAVVANFLFFQDGYPMTIEKIQNTGYNLTLNACGAIKTLKKGKSTPDTDCENQLNSFLNDQNQVN